MEIRVTVIQIFLLCFQTFADSATQEENEIRCNVPDLENGRYPSTNSDASVGERIRADCNRGYVIEDTQSGNEIQCLKGGNWDRDAVCIGKQCNKIPVLANGGYNWSGNDRPRYPKTLHAVCAPGYTLQNPSRNTITCGINSRWSTSRAVCRVKTCRVPLLSHGAYNPYVGRLVSFDERIKASCSTGYLVDGSSDGMTRCVNQGRWSPTITCTAGCVVSRLENGQFQRNNSTLLSENTTVSPSPPYYKVVCNSGYKLQPNHPNTHWILCKTTGRWARQFQCIGVQCQTLDPPAHGTLNSSTSVHRYPAILSITCDVRYTLQQGSSGILRCGPDGMWSGPVPECQAKECESLENITHGNYSVEEGSIPVFEDTIQFKCQSGFRIHLGDIPVDTYNRTCLANRKWSGPEPKCQVVHVSAPSCSDVQTGTIAGLAVGAAIFVLSSIVMVVVFIRSRRDRDNSIYENIATPERGRRNISGRTGQQRGMEMTGQSAQQDGSQELIP